MISAIVLIFILVMISFPIFTYTYYVHIHTTFFFIEDLNFYLIYYGYDYIRNGKEKQENFIAKKLYQGREHLYI